MDVDQFIDRYTPMYKFASDAEREGERYARFVLMLFRLPAALALDFQKFTPRLFCTFNKSRYRVVFASRFGWIGLTTDPEKGTYDRQVNLSECSAWGPKP